MSSGIIDHPARTRANAGPVELVQDEPLPQILEGEVQPASSEALDSPVLERLHALVRKGYRPQIGTGTATDIILLRHVGKAPDLVLHSNGEVEGFDGRRPRYKRDIEPPAPFAPDSLAEQLRFMKFLDSVPKATLRDRTRRWRQKYVYFPLVMAILLAIHLAFTAIILDDGGAPPPAETTGAAAPGVTEPARAAEAEAARAGARAIEAGRAQAEAAAREAAKAVPPAP